MTLTENVQQTDGKSFLKSKRFWTAVLTAAIPFIPYLGPLAAAHPDAFAGIVGAVFGWVGLATKEPIKMSDPVKTILRIT